MEESGLDGRGIIQRMDNVATFTSLNSTGKNFFTGFRDDSTFGLEGTSADLTIFFPVLELRLYEQSDKYDETEAQVSGSPVVTICSSDHFYTSDDNKTLAQSNTQQFQFS
ncbi:hypothetical protein L1887_11790 [Cichorium endivia]|nr:hypothetical protein L1887_11790 [Cichorium endivia]